LSVLLLFLEPVSILVLHDVTALAVGPETVAPPKHHHLIDRCLVRCLSMNQQCTRGVTCVAVTHTYSFFTPLFRSLNTWVCLYVHLGHIAQVQGQLSTNDMRRDSHRVKERKRRKHIVEAFERDEHPLTQWKIRRSVDGVREGQIVVRSGVAV